MELLINFIRIQWNAFKGIQIYDNLTLGALIIGVFVVGTIASFINMFIHRGE